MRSCKDEITKAEILAAAQKLFQKMGLRKATMEDIAREICKGKSTLYYYYCSKEEIFEAVIRKELEEICGKTAEAVTNAQTAENKLKAYSLTRLKTLRSMSNLYHLVKNDMMESTHCTHRLNREFEEREIKLLRDILHFGINNGEFHQRLLDQLDIMPYIIISTLKGFEFDLFNGNRFENIELRIDAIIELMMKGLANNPLNAKPLLKQLPILTKN